MKLSSSSPWDPARGREFSSRRLAFHPQIGHIPPTSSTTIDRTVAVVFDEVETFAGVAAHDDSTRFASFPPEGGAFLESAMKYERYAQSWPHCPQCGHSSG